MALSYQTTQLIRGAIGMQEAANEVIDAINAAEAGEVPAGSISTTELADLAVTEDKLADSAVAEAKIEDAAVTTDKIDDAAVTEGKLADSAVATDKLDDAAVTEGKLADGAVATDKLADRAVTTGKIDDLAVDVDKISNVNGAVKLQRIDVGFAALNAAGSGVAALFGVAIPANCLIIRTYIDVTESFGDDGTEISTIKIGLEDQDDDVLASDTLDALAEGLVEGIQVGTMAAALKLSAPRQLAVTFTESGAEIVLDAGAMSVFVEYVQSV